MISMIHYHWMTLSFVAKLKHLPDCDEKGSCRVDREWCVQEGHISCITWRIISQAMIDKHQSSQLP